MKTPLRGLAKDFSVYGVGYLIVRASGLLTMPVYTRLLKPKDYGVLNFVVAATALLSGILSFGGESAYNRLIFEAKSPEERKEIASTFVLFLFFTSLIVIAFSLPSVGRFSLWSFGVEDHKILFGMALAGIPFVLVNAISGQVLRNRFQSRQFVKLDVATTFVTVSLGLYSLVVLRLGIVGLAGATLIGALAMFPLRLWSVRDVLGARFSRPVLWKYLRFGIPLVPLNVAYWLFSGADKLMIGKFSTLSELGLYSVASGIVGGMAVVLSSLGQAWAPYAIKMHEEDPERASFVFGRMMTLFCLVFGVLSVALAAFSKEILLVLAAPSFAGAGGAIGPLALSVFANATAQVTALGIALKKKTYFISLVAGLAGVVNVGLNFLLIPKFGMVGAAWATAVSYGVSTTMFLIISQRHCPVVYETRATLRIVGLTILFVGALPFLSVTTVLRDLFVKATLFLVFLGTLWGFKVVKFGEIKELLS